jgi:phosphoribosylaminoimidazole-succinocarboxamide synthase
MVDENTIRKAMNSTCDEAYFPTLGNYRKGKVRDIYDLGDKMIFIITDRVSAFDAQLKQPIPFKGRSLNQTTKFWFDKVKGIVPSHIINCPHPNVMVTKKANPYPIEVIVRGYATGSLWRAYEKGARIKCGVPLPDGLKKDQKFPTPILTPTTKSEHDEDITREEIIAQGLVPKEVYEKIEDAALKIFKMGQEFSEKQGLILVDTKYEFADYNGELILIDEVHTGDSSRYWVASEYAKHFGDGTKQRSIDKEYIRQWLLDQGFEYGQSVPELPEKVIITAAQRYIEQFERITGEKFEVIKSNKPLKESIKEALIKEGLLCWYQ